MTSRLGLVVKAGALALLVGVSGLQAGSLDILPMALAIPVPEPSSMLVLGVDFGAVVGLALLLRNRRKRG